MATKLNHDLAKAVDQQGDVPVQAVHPETGKIFFLISEDRYQQLKPLFEEDPISEEEQRFLLAEGGKRAGWDDPIMDVYDQYDQHRPPKQPWKSIVAM